MPYKLRGAPRAEVLPPPEPGELAALYAGSFDPPTNGHLWVVERAAQIFPRLVVAVAGNPAKKRAISMADSAAILAVECARIADRIVAPQAPEIAVSVCPPSVYVADLARRLGCSILVRGLRGAEDLAQELMLLDFAHARAGLQTIFLTPPAKLRGLSSSYVRALVGPKGWRRLVRPLVPPGTYDQLKKGPAT